MSRPRDNKGRLVPKYGVAKWGNDYWGYGVSYQDWKYRHPASVRVFAEGYGVDLKGLTSAQKDWLKMRYEEDVDSKTALFALIDEFNLRSRRAESFSADDEECQVEDCEGTPCDECGFCDICEGGDINPCCARRTYGMRKGWGAESFSAPYPRKTGDYYNRCNDCDGDILEDQYQIETTYTRRYCVDSDRGKSTCGMDEEWEETEESYAESFSGEWIGEKPFQEYLPDKEDVKVAGVVALTGLIVGWFINNQLLRKK
jgi:hypothetical protein